MTPVQGRVRHMVFLPGKFGLLNNGENYSKEVLRPSVWRVLWQRKVLTVVG